MKRAGSDVQKAIYLILYDKSTALKDAIIREDEQYRTTRGVSARMPVIVPQL